MLIPLISCEVVIQTQAVWLHTHALSCCVMLSFLHSPPFIMHYLFVIFDYYDLFWGTQDKACSLADAQYTLTEWI